MRLERRKRMATHAIPVAAMTKAAAQAANIMMPAGLVIDGISASKSLATFGAAPHFAATQAVTAALPAATPPGQLQLRQHWVYLTISIDPSGGGLATVLWLV